MPDLESEVLSALRLGTSLLALERQFGAENVRLAVSRIDAGLRAAQDEIERQRSRIFAYQISSIAL